MTKQVFSRTRSPSKRTSEFSSVSDGAIFESRPFAVQSKVGEEGEKSGLKTSLNRAERYGHHLSQAQGTRMTFATAIQPAYQEVIQRMGWGSGLPSSVKQAPTNDQKNRLEAQKRQTEQQRNQRQNTSTNQAEIDKKALEEIASETKYHTVAAKLSSSDNKWRKSIHVVLENAYQTKDDQSQGGWSESYRLSQARTNWVIHVHRSAKGKVAKAHVKGSGNLERVTGQSGHLDLEYLKEISGIAERTEKPKQFTNQQQSTSGQSRGRGSRGNAQQGRRRA